MNDQELFSWGGRAHYGDRTAQGVNTLCGKQRPPAMLVVQPALVRPEAICPACAQVLNRQRQAPPPPPIELPEYLREILGEAEGRERMLDRIEARARLEGWK